MKKELKIKTELKLKHAMVRFNVSRKTITRWCADDLDPMPHVKRNNIYYFDPEEIELWWDRQRTNKAS